jgi:hypothetical protein
MKLTLESVRNARGYMERQGLRGIDLEKYVLVLHPRDFDEALAAGLVGWVDDEAVIGGFKIVVNGAKVGRALDASPRSQ